MLAILLQQALDDWPTTTLIAVGVVVLIKQFWPQLSPMLPSAMKNYFELRKAEQVHDLEVEKQNANTTQMKELSQLNALYHRESQITEMTSEVQSQLSEANSYIRKIVLAKLDTISDQILLMQDTQSEIKDIMTFILQRIDRANNAGYDLHRHGNQKQRDQDLDSGGLE